MALVLIFVNIGLIVSLGILYRNFRLVDVCLFVMPHALAIRMKVGSLVQPRSRMMKEQMRKTPFVSKPKF